MKFLRKLFGKATSGEKLDVSETVSDVVGGGLVGLAVGELVEEGVKEVKRARAKSKTKPRGTTTKK